MQCPKDGCDGEEAAFFQVQIRSADEPMTNFYMVCVVYVLSLGAKELRVVEALFKMYSWSETRLMLNTVHDLQK